MRLWSPCWNSRRHLHLRGHTGRARSTAHRSSKVGRICILQLHKVLNQPKINIVLRQRLQCCRDWAWCAKVKNIYEMPVPQDWDDLQRFLGMVTYMGGGFIPNLSRLSSILRDLLRKDVPFEWSEDHQMAFDTLKGAVTTETSMAYYDITKPIILEVDASQNGLGAALVQEKKQLNSRRNPSQRRSRTTAT